MGRPCAAHGISCAKAVLVFHTSRFARSQVEARRYKQLLRERLGIRVVSVTQPMGEDPTDPSAFLAESIHEMFDEYYSVSLSFWTRSGLHEKARQGHLVGMLPWGYRRDPDTKLAADPQLDRAQKVLGDFPRFWHAEPDPAERRKLINSLFDHIWQDNGAIIAVKPRPTFAPYFRALDETRPKPSKADQKKGVTKAGTTGVEPGLYTPRD
jgi:hypothetical protein